MSNKLFKKSGKFSATLKESDGWRRITIYEDDIDDFGNAYKKEIKKILDHESLFEFLEPLIFEQTKEKVLGALTH